MGEAVNSIDQTWSKVFLKTAKLLRLWGRVPECSDSDNTRYLIAYSHSGKANFQLFRYLPSDVSFWLKRAYTVGHVSFQAPLCAHGGYFCRHGGYFCRQ